MFPYKNLVLKGLASVGVLAATVVVGKQLVGAPVCEQTSFACVNKRGKKLLASDKDVTRHLLTLERFRDTDAVSYDNIVLMFVRVIHLHQLTVENSTRLPFRITADAYAAVHAFQSHVKLFEQGMLAVFADQQEAVTDFKDARDALIALAETYAKNIQLNICAQR